MGGLKDIHVGQALEIREQLWFTVMSDTVAQAASPNLSPIDDKSTVPITLNTADAGDAQPRSASASKSRKRAASSDGQRDDTKKQRGRPRVEPKDETAADVR